MIVERMRYELLKRYGESEEMNVESEAQDNGNLNELQRAFEYLAYYIAWSRHNHDKEKEEKAWEALDIIKSVLGLTTVQAKFIVNLVAQCPREFALFHMTEFSRNLFNDLIDSLEEKGLIERKEIRSYFCSVVSHRLMRTLAFGLDWEKARTKEKDPLSKYLEHEDND